MKALVIGASGYLGSALVKELLSQGHEVRAAVRDFKKGMSLPVGVDVRTADVTDPETLPAAMLGCDKVFHVAAYVQTWNKNKKIFDDINVTGLINSVEAAKKVGIEKFIYTSSFMALGPSPKGGIINEASARITNRLHNDYERTKYLGLLEAGKIAETGFPIVTVHPTVIYGPGPLTSGNLVGKTIMDLINGKIPGVIGSGKQLWNYAHVNDVCKGHILAAEKGKSGESYILGGENISISEFMQMVGDLTGVEIPKKHLPIWLLLMVGAVQETIALMGGKLPDMTRGIAGIYALNWAYSSEKAEKELGYSPISFKKGLEETVKWIQGILKEKKM